MGRVYLAYDPELDRKVALKILRGSTRPSRSRALLHEAQAMAKLAHSNVVGVHDVGEHEGAVYVAMEFVEGSTLREWLAAHPGPWREVLDVFLDAGRGLEAAHERGLIHRDFKPDNVMVTTHGHASVMDFGLAREHEAPVERVAGTPGYMAPEQAVAGTLTPAADQFAFCVSLWEGICGERPFDSPTYAELLRNMAEGRIRTPTPERSMPWWLQRTLARGLRPKVEERWPSMTALLDALERGKHRRRWQIGIGIGIALSLALGLGYARQRRNAQAHQDKVAACEAEGAAIIDVWNDDARARLDEGMRATGVDFAAHSVETLVPWLDAYASSWQTGRTQVCQRASIENEWSDTMADHAAWCFEDRRLQLEATIDQISTGDAKAARRAVRLVSYLDPVETCLDPKLLARFPAPPIELRDRIRTIRARLIEVDRLRHRGMYSEALEAARETRAQAENLRWPPLTASTRMIEGRCLIETGRHEQAGPVLTATYFEALDAGSIEVAFRAARSLIRTHGVLQHHREAETWARHASAIASDKIDLGRLDEAEGHYLLIEVNIGLGNYAEAIRQGERALSLRAQTLGDDHPITAAALRNLANAYLFHGRTGEALDMFERAHDVWQAAVGPEHPHVANLRVLRGRTLLALDRPDEARSMLLDALAIHEAVLAPGHPSIAANLAELGSVLARLGKLDEAQQTLTYAKSLQIARFGAEHRAVADTMLREATVETLRGDYERAAQTCRDARAILERLFEPTHPEVARAIEMLADVELARGSPDEAATLRLQVLRESHLAHAGIDRQDVARWVAVADAQRAAGDDAAAETSSTRAHELAQSLASDPALTVLPASALAELALARGEASAALRFATRAVNAATTAQVARREAARAHFVHAEALAANDAQPAEIRDAAVLARKAYTTQHDDDGLQHLDTWLTERASE